jgi:ABC-type branched-subunit amino acid transport system substrate-binding protein
MKPRLLLSLLFVGLLLATALDANAGRRKRNSEPDPIPNLISQAIALAEDDRLEALALLEGYLADGQDPALLQLCALHAGEQRRLMGDLETAAAHFQYLRRQYASVEPAMVGLALVHAERGFSENGLATLEMIGDEGVPDTMNADRYRVLALASVAEGAPVEEQQRLAALALQYALGDDGVAIRVRLDLGAILPFDAEGMDGFVPADTDALARARSALSAGNYLEAVRLVDALEAQFPNSALQVEASWVRLRAEVEDPFSPNRVGVLLPLTGTYGPAGQQLKETLELAIRDGGSPVHLIFRDTAGTPETALEKFRDLVLGEGVAAVVGPLLKEVARPVAAEAQAAEVPLLTLSQVGGLTETGHWIFRGVLTIQHQVRSLVDHVMGPMGLQTFVVLAPDNSYGRTANDAFIRLVTERGGEVKRVVFYDPNATDYRDAASELGLKNIDAPERKEELNKLRRQAKARGVDYYKVVLPPLMDFQAIFVPDNAHRIPIVASSLAYEEFSIGGFSPRQAMKPVPLIGLNGWHHPAVAFQGRQYTENAVFVDAFDVTDDSEFIQAFVSTFQGELGRSPGVLESLVYDAGRLLAVAFEQAPDNRADMRQKLSGAQLEQSITGGTSFGATREVERELLVFRIGEEGIERWQEPDDMLTPQE